MASIEQRSNSKGEVSYRAKVRLKGYPPQSATFKRKTDAKNWISDTESAIRNGRYFQGSESKKHTLSELIDRYIENVLPDKSSSKIFLKNQEFQLKWWKAQIGDYLLSDITASKISALKDKLVEEKNRPTTANRYLAALSHCYNTAINEWEWTNENPVKKVKKSKESSGVVRFLSDDERSRLLEACKELDHTLYILVVTALSTGARRGELLNAKWQDLNLEKEVLIIYETKNKEIKALPIKGLNLKLLKEAYKNKKPDIEYIFPSTKGFNKPKNIEGIWRASLKKANIDNFRFHDLRHSAASYLAMNGASLAEIAEVLGHKTLQMVKRYAHLSESHTASVVERMNKKVFGDE